MTASLNYVIASLPSLSSNLLWTTSLKSVPFKVATVHDNIEKQDWSLSFRCGGFEESGRLVEDFCHLRYDKIKPSFRPFACA
jgi:hypothetical protein